MCIFGKAATENYFKNKPLLTKTQRELLVEFVSALTNLNEITKITELGAPRYTQPAAARVRRYATTGKLSEVSLVKSL